MNVECSHNLSQNFVDYLLQLTVKIWLFIFSDCYTMRKGWWRHSSAVTRCDGSKASIGSRKSENSCKNISNHGKIFESSEIMQMMWAGCDLGSLRRPFILLGQDLVQRPRLQLRDVPQLAWNNMAKLSTRFRGDFHNIYLEKALSSSLLPKCGPLWPVVNRAEVSESWKFCESINKKSTSTAQTVSEAGKTKIIKVGIYCSAAG